MKAEGNAAFQAGDYRKAVECYSKAITADASDHVLYANRSGAYAAQHQFLEALADAEKCISMKKDWHKGYSRKGFALLQLGRLDDATAAYSEGLSIDANNAALKQGMEECRKNADMQVEHHLISRVAQLIRTNDKFRDYAQQDKSFVEKLTTTLRESLKNPASLRMAVSLHPDPRIQEALRAILGIDESDEPDAGEAARRRRQREEEKTKQEPKVDTRTPEQKEADAAKEEGNELYKQKQFERAVACYEKAIALVPWDLTYRSNLAAVHLESSNFDRCLATCREALSLRSDPNSNDPVKVSKIYHRMAICYRRMKKFDLSAEMFDQSLLENQDRHVRAAKREMLREKEKLEKDEYLDPEAAEQARVAGNELFRDKQFPQAKAQYDEGIRRNPDDARLYANRAAALAALLDLPSALSDCEKALQLDPNFVRAWSRKGNVHLQMKEYHKALSAFQSGLQVDSNSAECRQGLETTLMKIQESQVTDRVDEEQVKHAMADPEIRQILGDPQFRLLLDRASTDPSVLADAMKEPTVAKGVQKLVAAGILKIGSG